VQSNSEQIADPESGNPREEERVTEPGAVATGSKHSTQVVKARVHGK
jgi:hypothetical protein